MSPQIGYALLTAIQNRVTSALNDLATAPTRATLLLQLLNSDEDLPTLEALNFPDLLDKVNVDGLLDAFGSRLQSGLKPAVADFVGKLNLGDLSEFGQKLIDDDPIAVVKKAIDDVRGTLEAGALPDAIHRVVRRQAGIGISFVTTLKNLGRPGLAEDVLNGWKSYFFKEGGFTTVDGIQLVAPGHAGLLDKLKDQATFEQGLAGLRGLLNERSAEQYVRDLIRILVEVGGDARFDLRSRLDQLVKPDKVKDPAKARRWFKGAASMAESLLTSAVEELTLGVAQFQTNPVLAAAAATYAGTGARKASQHLFLAECGV